MFRSRKFRRFTVWLSLVSVTISPGCSRRFWRQQAQQDTYQAVAEKLNDSRWDVPRFDITPDKRSRFYDPYDPDCGPLPPDDPAAHEFMHCVNGIPGYKSWHKFGDTISTENPQWLEAFGVSAGADGQIDPVQAHSSVQLTSITLDEAIELSYIHSREYQTAIEDLYLTALDLTFQRYQFGVRYLGIGGQEPNASYNGGFEPGSDSHSTRQSFGISQALPAGGQWAAEIANNTLWLFGTGGGPPVSSSNLAFSLVQPLLFRAGRKVALENLTQSERNVLYSARDLAQFRKNFFTNVASSYLRILQQRQAIINSEGNIERLRKQIEIQTVRDARRPRQVPAELRRVPDDFQIPEALQDRLIYDAEDGFLFWRGQEITDAEVQAVLAVSDDADYQNAATVIIELLRSDTTSLNTLQLLTQLSDNLNQLRDLERGLQDQKDVFKTQLGLPPDINLDIDTSLLRPFELINPELSATEERLEAALDMIERPLDAPADFAKVVAFLSTLESLIEDVQRNGFDQVQADFEPVEKLVTEGRSEDTKRVFLDENEVQRVQTDLDRDRRLYKIARSEFGRALRDLQNLKTLIDGDDPATAFRKLDLNNDGTIALSELEGIFDKSLRSRLDINEDQQASEQELVEVIESIAREIREEVLRSAQSLEVLQAGLRTELVAVNRFTLPGETTTPSIDEVVRIGVESRVDLMNTRAEVMDARRRLEVAANALESTLNLQVDGEVRTRPGNRKPFDFRQDESRLDVGVQFTTPLDQIQERNAYAAALVTYQRARRNYMRAEDNVKNDIRNSWRQLQVSERQLEIDRQQIRQAALQYDNAAQQAARGGQNNALSLLQSLASLLNAQNRLIRDWIRYELNRLNIYRDMGIMEIDPSGLWNDEFYQQGQNSPAQPGLNTDPASPQSLPNPEATDEPLPEIPPAPQASGNLNVMDVARRRDRRWRPDRSNSVMAERHRRDVLLGGLRPL